MFTRKSIGKSIFIIAIVSAFWWTQNGAAEYNNSQELATDSNEPIIGSPFNISTGSIDETLPAVAFNPLDREFLVVWNNVRATHDIYAQRISENGKLLSWFYVADGKDPDVAYNPENNTYLVVYYRQVGPDADIFARRVDFTGPTDPEFQVASNLNENEVFPSVAYNTHPSYDQFLVVWVNEISIPSSTQNIEAIRVAGTAGGGDGGGETVGSRIPVAVSSDISYDPDVAYNLNMNEFLVVYTRIGTSLDVYSRRVTGGGALLPEESIDTSGNDQYNPSVAAYRLNTTNPYLVVFTDTWNDSAGDVRGYLINKQGQPVQLINIATTPGHSEIDPSINYGETWGGYLVTWLQGTTGDVDIFGRRVSQIGLTFPEFDISGTAVSPTVCDRWYPDVGMGHSAALAVWSDNCGSGGGFDILGRMLGYRVNLPMTIR